MKDRFPSLGNTASAAALVLATLFSTGAAQAGALYTAQNGTLTIPALNFPGNGTFQVQLTARSALLRVGTVFQFTSAAPNSTTDSMPANYNSSTKTIYLVAVAVRSADGLVNYFDIKLRMQDSAGQSWIVDSVDDTLLGQTLINNAQGVAGSNGTSGTAGTAGTPGPTGATGATGATGPAGPAGTGVSGTFGTNTNTVTQGTTTANLPTCVIGSVMLMAGTKFPTNYLKADGTVVTSTTYPALVSYLGGASATNAALPSVQSAAPNGLTYVICATGITP